MVVPATNDLSPIARAARVAIPISSAQHADSVARGRRSRPGRALLAHGPGEGALGRGGCHEPDALARLQAGDAHHVVRVADDELRAVRKPQPVQAMRDAESVRGAEGTRSPDQAAR